MVTVFVGRCIFNIYRRSLKYSHFVTVTVFFRVSQHQKVFRIEEFTLSGFLVKSQVLKNFERVYYH